MSGVPNVGHQTQGPRELQTPSAWDPGRNRIGNMCLFICSMFDLGRRLFQESPISSVSSSLLLSMCA